MKLANLIYDVGVVFKYVEEQYRHDQVWKTAGSRGH